MTLYRTAEANPIITALARAAENQKQVTALVELQARLDEENNIDKARDASEGGRPRRLRDRRPQDPLQGGAGRSPRARRDPPLRPPRHGQLQPDDRAPYTDLSFFTCRPEFGEDASALFNLLTGILARATTGTS